MTPAAESHSDESSPATPGATRKVRTRSLIHEDVQAFYQRSSDGGRRMINQAFCKKLYAYEGAVVGEEFAEPFDALIGVRSSRATYQRRRVRTHANRGPEMRRVAI